MVLRDSHESIALAADADHRHLLEPELERVGHADDLQDATLDEPIGAGAHRCFGHAEIGRDLGVRPPPVRLEVLDDPLVEVGDLLSRPRSWSFVAWGGRRGTSWRPPAGYLSGYGLRARVSSPGWPRDRAMPGRPRRHRGPPRPRGHEAATAGRRGSSPGRAARRAWRCPAGAAGQPVVGPHSTRMFRPAIAIGGSPWTGSPASPQSVTRVSDADVRYWLTVNGQPNGRVDALHERPIGRTGVGVVGAHPEPGLGQGLEDGVGRRRIVEVRIGRDQRGRARRRRGARGRRSAHAARPAVTTTATSSTRVPRTVRCRMAPGC